MFFPAFSTNKLHIAKMVDELMESYLNNIAEQVVDEDKIVTYKSLSRSLGIHVNTAKQLLYTYLTNEKSKNSFPISATYLVAGKIIDGSFNVTVVNEADLKKAYSTFVEVTSEHIYSVQKGKCLKELRVLSGVKGSSKSENSKPVITCSKGVLKSRLEEKKKPESCQETNKKVIAQALLPEKEKVAVVETNKKVETTRSKESISKSPKKTSPKGNAQKGQGNVRKPAGNIANLFAKAAEKNAGKATNSGKLDTNSSKIVPKDIENADADVVEPEKNEKEKLETKSESKESLKKKKGNKRKRIQMLSDSEESDSNDEEEIIEIEEIEDSPPNPINIEDEEEEEEKEVTKGFIPRKKRKKRKVIDRTVMNEDGYLVTKKEVVFETDSEDEAEEPTTASKKTKAEPMNDKGKGGQGAAGTAKKQSSLLTFFKKN